MKSVKKRLKATLKGISIFLLSLFMVAREGLEIVLFVVADSNGENICLLIMLSILLGALIGILLYFSIIKIDIQKLFKITLFYLILQVG